MMNLFARIGADDDIGVDAIAYHEKRIRYTVFAKLEELIDSLVAKPMNSEGTIARGHSDHRSPMSECDCRKVGQYLHELRRLDLWPLSKSLHDHTLGELLEKLEHFQDLEADEPSENCPSCNIDFRQKLRDISKSLRRSFGGLCFDCFKRGIKDEDWYACGKPYNT